MDEDLKRHLIDYFLLAAIFISCLFVVFVYRFDRTVQIAASVVLGIGYILWGIFHHLVEKSLTLRTLLEYISLSALITTTLIVFLLRA